VSLSSEQLRAFRERGYFNLGRVFDAPALAELGAAYDAALEKPMRIGERGKSKFEYGPLLQLRSSVLRRFATSRALVEPLLSLLGPDVRLYWDQAVSKPAGTGSETPWHQDNGYGAVVPAEYVTTTLALDPMTIENGCLWIQPGSHHAGPRPHRDTGGFFQIGYEGPETGEPLELAAGEVGVFSSLTLHRAGANPTSRPRRSWVIQFIPGHAIHGETRRPFDDRLWVARNGKWVDEPWSERAFDLTALG
jgi:hypothetical protein